MDKCTFMKRFRYFLCPYFKEKERNDILLDYESWFCEETADGVSDTDLCKRLGSPKDLAKKIWMEENRPFQPFISLLSYQRVRFLLFYVFAIFAAIMMYKMYETYHVARFFPWIVGLVMIYAVQVLLFRKEMMESFRMDLSVLLPLFMTALSVVVSSIQDTSVAVIYHVILQILFMAICVMACVDVLCNKNASSLCMHLTHSVISVFILLFQMHQLHAFYLSQSQVYYQIVLPEVLLCLTVIFPMLIVYIAHRRLHLSL